MEFAIIAPMLFMLIFGLIEFARFLMVQQSLSNAAREGSRKAALVSTVNQSDADTAVRDFLEGTIPNAADVGVVQVTISPTTLNGLAPGTPITTSIAVNYSDISWLPLNAVSFLTNSVVRASSTMERE